MVMAKTYYSQGINCMVYVVRNKDKKYANELLKTLHEWGYETSVPESSEGEVVFEISWSPKV